MSDNPAVDRLFRVTARNFVAGFIVRGPVISRHAPILKKWLSGKTAGAGYRALLKSGFAVEEVAAPPTGRVNPPAAT